MTGRRTIVVHTRLGGHMVRVEAARAGANGVRVLTMGHLAARLAGGFIQPIDPEALQQAVRDSLAASDLGELEAIKALPGMARAVVGTLDKVWRAGIELPTSSHPRLQALAALERDVLRRLPPSMKRPAELVDLARSRIRHAPTILGEVEIHGHSEMPVCWRPLLFVLARATSVVWVAGSRLVPNWLSDTGIEVRRTAPTDIIPILNSCATPQHEVLEAFRWMRALLVEGKAKPEQIGIAAASPADFDDHVLALSQDANIPLHFVHGIKAAATPEGQTAAALADILVKGISQERVRRLFRRLHGTPALAGLPDEWTRILPRTRRSRQSNAGNGFSPRLSRVTGRTAWTGPGSCSTFCACWRKGPMPRRKPAKSCCRRCRGSSGAVLSRMGLRRPCRSRSLACGSRTGSSRRLTQSGPRPSRSRRRRDRSCGFLDSMRDAGRVDFRGSADPGYIIPVEELDPLPLADADRRDFVTIIASARASTISFSRRDVEGRLLGRSPLIADLKEVYLNRGRTPEHAASESIDCSPGRANFGRPRSPDRASPAGRTGTSQGSRRTMALSDDRTRAYAGRSGGPCRRVPETAATRSDPFHLALCARLATAGGGRRAAHARRPGVRQSRPRGSADGGERARKRRRVRYRYG